MVDSVAHALRAIPKSYGRGLTGWRILIWGMATRGRDALSWYDVQSNWLAADVMRKS